MYMYTHVYPHNTAAILTLDRLDEILQFLQYQRKNKY